MKKHIVPVEVLELQDGDYHLFISAYVGRKKIRLLIDSGASKTILSKAYCKEAKTLKLVRSEYKATGLGTIDMESWFTEIKSFRIGNFKIKNFVCGVLDISHVSEIYSQLQLPPFDGVLGCDILVSYAVTLDLKRKLLIIPN
jgi:predicted aspartyl protease